MTGARSALRVDNGAAVGQNSSMRIPLMLLVTLPLLTACGGGYHPLEGPVADMRGVDANKYNQDLVVCQDQKRQASFVGSAQMISNCMAAKGYTIIEPKG
jgi:hypothetical protein